MTDFTELRRAIVLEYYFQHRNALRWMGRKAYAFAWMDAWPEGHSVHGI